MEKIQQLENALGVSIPSNYALNERGEVFLLYLDNNAISDVTALGLLTNLETLYLHNNEIVDVSALGLLTNLETLYLSGNKIVDVSALQTLTNLEQLGLRGNPVAESDVAELRKKLPKCTIYF